MITDKRLCLGGLVLRATDGFLLATTLLLTLLALFFHSRVEGWPVLVLMNAAAALLYVCVVFAGWKVRSRVAKFLLRTSAVEGYFIYLFLVVHKLQLIIVRSWQDPAVLGLERSVFGVQPNVWLQKLTTPVLTEWLMFAYVIYDLIYPVLAALIYFKRGEDKLEDYFFTLAVVNVLCCLGFILFPVASPMHWIRGQFTVPLKGFFFTSVGEFVRGHLHPVGGSIPQPARRRRLHHGVDGLQIRAASVLCPGARHSFTLCRHVLWALSLHHGHDRRHPRRRPSRCARAGSRKGMERPAHTQVKRPTP